MTDPTPTPAPSFADVKTVVVAFLTDVLQTGALKQELADFIDARLHTAVADLLAQLTADESTLMLPLTAWANGWMQQIRTDYSPGGILEQTGKNIAHSVKVFLPNPEA